MRVRDVEDGQGVVMVVSLDPVGGQLGSLPEVDSITAWGRHRVAPLVHGIRLQQNGKWKIDYVNSCLTGLSQASPNIKPQMFSGDCLVVIITM